MANESVFEECKQWYLSRFQAFEDSLNGGAELPFHTTRKQAISRFSELGLPTPGNEEWKYTNVAPIFEQKYEVAAQSEADTDVDIGPFTFGDLSRNRMVFLNGTYSKELSSFSSEGQGLLIGNLSELLENDKVRAHLGRYANFTDEPFTAINTAFANEGTVVYVPSGLTVKEPLHILHLSDGSSAPFATNPRNLFVVEDGGQVSVLESYHQLAGGSYFNNAVAEIFVGKNARVEHTKIQQEALDAYHIATFNVHQERESHFASVNIDLGGRLVRNNLNVMLNGEHCETHLLGFYVGSGVQHIDNHTFIDHAKPHCFSNELYKGILDDHAQGVFNGKILVRQDAQKTNALQSNKTLLLTDDAAINAKPQLEIFADDVKCTHGATIGQLDDEALFYLRCRGIGKDMAEAMLRHAFVADVLEGIKDGALRETIDAKIIDRFTS